MTEQHTRIVFDAAGFQGFLNEMTELPLCVCEPLFMLMVAGAEVFQFHYSHREFSNVNVINLRLEPGPLLASMIAKFSKDPDGGRVMTASSCTCFATRKERSRPELPVLGSAGMTPVCPKCRTMNISLSREDGTVLRFKMTPKEARRFARSLLDASKHVAGKGCMCPQCGLQSLRSSGSPQPEGSPQEGQVV